MKKINVSLLLSSFILFGLLFSTNQNQKENISIVKADPATATFIGFAGGWNPAAHAGENERYILSFSEELGKNNETNYCEEIGDHFQINGESLKSISTSLRIGHNNQGAKNLFIDIPTAKIVATDEYPAPVFHIDGGTPFQDYLLPELTFIIDTTTYTMMKSSNLTFSSFNNNIDYTNPHPDGVEGAHGEAPTNGAMVRIAFSDENNNTNVLGIDISANYEDHTAEWGENVLMNGAKLSTIDGAKVGASYGRLYVFVPTAAIELDNHNVYKYPLLEISESYFGVCLVPELAFQFTGNIGEINAWTKYAPPHQVAFNAIRWNGYVFGPDNNQYAGGQGHSGVKAGAMVEFNENLSFNSNYATGSIQLENLVNNPLGEGIDEHIRSNGVSFKEIEGAEIYYYQTNLLFLYTPNMNTPLEGKNYAEITFDENASMFDVLMPNLTLYYAGIDDVWGIDKPADANDKLIAFNKINSDYYNNHIQDNNSETILDFGENGVDYFSNDEQPDLTNRATKNYSIGYKLKLNGKPICEYPGSVVSYAHGKNHLYVSIPLEFLKPSGIYKIPTLHLDEATNFVDVSLKEVTLNLFNGKWVSSAETIPDEKYLSTNNYFDAFDAEDFDVGNNKVKIVGQVPNYENETDFAFEFKNDSENGSLAIYAFSNDEYSGLRLTIDLKNDIFSILDCSQGNVIDSISCHFESNEWYRVYFKVVFSNNNSFDYSLAIDDIVYLSGEEIEISSKDFFGEIVAIYSGIGVSSFSNPRPGNDIKKPVLSYNGEEICYFNIGDNMPDLKANCAAIDDVDGDVSDLIEIIWPEGSLTGDVLNKGNWDVTIKTIDNSGNFGILNIKVIVSDPNEVVVTFDGENPTYYTIGSLITKPEDPVKKDDKYATYTFIGWFNGDDEWDFENDYVTADLDLVSRFQTSERKYNVSIVTDEDVINMQLAYGEHIDLSVYEKDGFIMNVICNGEEYKQSLYEVRADATINISYQEIEVPVKPDNPNNKVEMGPVALYIGLACGVAVLIIGVELVFLIVKKKRK